MLCCRLLNGLKRRSRLLGEIRDGMPRIFFFGCCTTSEPGKRPEMKAWTLKEYNSYAGLSLDTMEVRRLQPDEILVKVVASSVNPLDVSMANGYGRRVINSLRSLQGVEEFPLVLGRDCSGIVVQRGRKVRRFEIGERVWCSRWVVGQGTHAQYVPVKVSEAALKPTNLSHTDAASLPFVACTVWPALISRGGLSTMKPGKSVLILGGSGGVGTLAVQLATCMGAVVTTTCRGRFRTLMETLGAEYVYDYENKSHIMDLKENEPYDIILDCRGGIQDNSYHQLLANDPAATYISLTSPVLKSTDDDGFLCGVANTTANFVSLNRNFLTGNGVYSWGFYFPSGGILEYMRKLVERDKIVPIIDSIYSFSETDLAYKRLDSGDVRGKVVISMET